MEKEIELIRKLTKIRFNTHPLLKPQSADISNELQKLAYFQLMGLPEGTLVTILKDYASKRKSSSLSKKEIIETIKKERNWALEQPDNNSYYSLKEFVYNQIVLFHEQGDVKSGYDNKDVFDEVYMCAANHYLDSNEINSSLKKMGVNPYGKKSDEEASLSRMSKNMGCHPDDAKDKFVSGLSDLNLNKYGYFLLLKDFREMKLRESKEYDISPEATAAAIMEKWIIEYSQKGDYYKYSENRKKSSNQLDHKKQSGYNPQVLKKKQQIFLMDVEGKITRRINIMMIRAELTRWVGGIPDYMLLAAYQEKRDKEVKEFNEEINKIKNNIANELHYNHFNSLGSIFYKKGNLNNNLYNDWEEAINYYRRSIELNSEFAETYYNLGVVLYKKGELEAAATNYMKAINLRPNYTKAFMNLGAALYSKGSFEEAIYYYQKALDLIPDSDREYLYDRKICVHCNLGSAFYENGNLKVAIKHYENALNLDRELPEAYFNLGNALYEDENLFRAILCYEIAIGLGIDFSNAYFNLSDALFKKGDKREALEQFEKGKKRKLREDFFYNLEKICIT